MKPYVKHDPSVRQKINDLRLGGVALRDIATQLGVEFSYVRSVLRKSGIKLTKDQERANKTVGRHKTMPDYAPGTTERILDLKRKGVKNADIASMVGVSIDKVLSDVAHSDVRLTKEQHADVRRKYPNEVRLKAISMRKNGKKFDDISSILGIDDSIIKYWCGQEGVVLTSEQRGDNVATVTTPELKEEVVALRQTGITRGEVATNVGVKLSLVKAILKKTRTLLPMEVRQKNSYAARLAKDPNCMIHLRSFCTAEHRKKAGISRSFRALKNSGFSTHAEKYRYYAGELGGEYLGAQEAGFIDVRTKCLWRCKNGHDFISSPASVMLGHWCPDCSRHTSKGQQAIYDYIKELLPNEEVVLNDRKQLCPYELDIWVPSKRFAIEFNGCYWHCSAVQAYAPGKEKKKALAVQEKGIDFLMIYEDEWEDKLDLVRAMIAHRLGVFNGVKIGARECTVEQIDQDEFGPFFERNCLDGNVDAKFAYGLRCNGKLLMCASARINDDGDIEIVRLVTDYDFIVPGGVSRLLTAIAKANPSKNICTFTSNRLTCGYTYRALGFTETPSGVIDYYYTDGNYRVGWWEFPKGMTEEQAESGTFSEPYFGDSRPLYRIEDCGHKKWVML